MFFLGFTYVELIFLILRSLFLSFWHPVSVYRVDRSRKFTENHRHSGGIKPVLHEMEARLQISERKHMFIH